MNICYIFRASTNDVLQNGVLSLRPRELSINDWMGGLTLYLISVYLFTEK